MNINQVIIIFLFLILQVIAQSYFCSGICAYQSCSGPLPTQCTGCSFPFITNGTTCSVDPNSGYVSVANQSHFGISNFNTANCTNDYYFHGDFLRNETIRISFDGSSNPIPHFRLMIITWVILIDKWVGSQNIVIEDKVNNQILTSDTATNLTQLQLCNGTSGVQTQKNLRVEQIFQHNQQNYTFDITATSTQATAKYWGMKEYMILVQKCSPECGDCQTSASNCLSCASTYFLSGTVCDVQCLANYGDPGDGTKICISCDPLCTECYSSLNNCTSCNSTTAFSISNLNQCVSSCPISYGTNYSLRSCFLCNTNCTACDSNANNCTSCISTHFFYQNTCYDPCPNGTYQSGSVCIKCDNECLLCDTSSSNCSECASGYFLQGNSCVLTCSSGNFGFQLNRTCIQCSLHCINATLNAYFPVDSNNMYFYVDIQFDDEIDFTTFPYETFQNFSISNANITQNDLVFSYQVLSNYKYRIKVELGKSAQLTNASISCQINDLPNDYYSKNGFQFSPSVYQLNGTVNWTITFVLVKYPQPSQDEKKFLYQISNASENINQFFSNKYLQQFKKTGIFGYLFAGSQATTTFIFCNTMPAQNLYEGARFWGSFVLFDIPNWQKQSSKTQYIVSPETNQVVKDKRLLLDINSVSFRFRRTGLTTFFLFDTYMPLLAIVIGWILLVIWKCLSFKFPFWKRHLGKMFAVFHKVHQLAIFYIMLGAVLQWIYFENSSNERIISLVINCVCLLYFLFYHVFIYRDLMRYPLATIGNDIYDQYVEKYAIFLKNIKFQQYNPKQMWTPLHWFRPYNFHLFSFFKKAMMMAALPIFYDIPHAQISILLILQTLEVIRTIVVWPYYKIWRNILRIILDIILALYFLCALIDSILIEEILSSEQLTNNSKLSIYYAFGWTGFFFVFIFNISYIILFIMELIWMCIWTDKERMDQPRKSYYNQKIQSLLKDAEKCEQNEKLFLQTDNHSETKRSMLTDYKRTDSQPKTPQSKMKNKREKQLMLKWLRAGNLTEQYGCNNEKSTSIKIEQYRIFKHQIKPSYEITLYKVSKMRKNTGNLAGVESILIQQAIKRTIVLVQKKSHILNPYVNQQGNILKVVADEYFYKIVKDIYWYYHKATTQFIIVRTIQNINEKQFKENQIVPFIDSDMYQVIINLSMYGQVTKDVLEKPYKSFPLSIDGLKLMLNENSN